MSTTEPIADPDDNAEANDGATTKAKSTSGLAWAAMAVMTGALLLIFLTLIYSTSNAQQSVDGEESTYSSNLE